MDSPDYLRGLCFNDGSQDNHDGRGDATRRGTQQRVQGLCRQRRIPAVRLCNLMGIA